MTARAAVIAAVIVCATTARADETPDTATDTDTDTVTDTVTDTDTDTDTATDTDTDPALSSARRAAAVGLAIVPGVGARGLGSHVAHQSRTGVRLLKLAGIGLGFVAVGGAPILVTYGSDKVLVPGTHLLVGGMGMVFGSWWSDIWASAGGRRLRGAARALPGLEVGLASTWQHDGFRGERFYATPSLVARSGRWTIAASAFVTDDATSFGGRAELGARLWGRRGDDRTVSARHNATYLEARSAWQLVRERDDRITLGTIEVELRARVDLALVDRNLRGTFFQLSEGLGLETATYRPGGGTDVNAILLSRFTWGAYLPCDRGELAVWYDHRRDQLAGGLPAGRAAGFFGSVGTNADVVVARGVAVVAQLEIGSGWITTVGVRKEIDR